MHPQARYLLSTPSSSQHPQVSSTTSEYLVLLTPGIRYLLITPRSRQPPPSTSSSSPRPRPPCNMHSSVSLPMHSTSREAVEMLFGVFRPQYGRQR